MIRPRPLLLAMALFFPLAGAAAPDSRPNVLFIISDDLTTTALSSYNPSTPVLTPNLERLASMSTRFERAYCNYPICGPSRTSFLSGRYPVTTEVLNNGVDPRVVLGADTEFLPEYFAAQGYFTAGIGKVMHTPEQHHAITWDIGVDPQYDPSHDFPEERDDWLAAPAEAHPDGITARWAAKLIEEHRDEPFFICAGFHKPHAPRVTPQEFFDLYPMNSVKVELGETEPDIPEIALPPGFSPDLPEAKWQAMLQSYYACVSFMDAQVGLLLDTLERLELMDKTVIVFVSDNGYHMGEHGGFWQKGSLMDQSARVPLMIHASGMSDNAACVSAVELVDLYPTLVELCGLPKAEGLEGNSLAPLLKDPGAEWNRPARSIMVRGDKVDGHLEFGRSVHTQDYSYILWPDGSRQLYHDAGDAEQHVNLASNPEYAPKIAELEPLLVSKARVPAHRGIKSEKSKKAKKAMKAEKNSKN